MKPRIVVVGSSNTDMIIKLPELPSPGETVLGGEFHMVNGGKGANQAIAAARAGGEVFFIACTGNDSFGKNAREALEKEGIDISCVKITNEKPSGIALINVSESGENSISVAPGANNLLTPADIEKYERIIVNADALLIQLEVPVETVYRTIEIAHEHQVPVILNPAPAQKLDPEFLKLVSIITPNENEAMVLTSQSDNKDHSLLTEAMINMGTETVIITLGENGGIYAKNGKMDYFKANQVIAKDTTAAGDTFNGYLAVALAEGMVLKDAVLLANNAASIAVTRIGASSSIPFLEEVNNALSKIK